MDMEASTHDPYEMMLRRVPVSCDVIVVASTHDLKHRSGEAEPWVIYCTENAYEGQSKSNLISIPVLISTLCLREGVPFVAKIDIEVTPSSSCDIHRIEVEYMKDEAEKKKKGLVDTSPVVDVKSMEAGPTQPTPTVEPSGIPTPSTPIASAPTLISRPPLTHTMIYKMGNFAYSVDLLSEIPLATVTEDAAAVDEGGESDTPEIDEEELVTRENEVYEDLKDLKGDLLQVAIEASLRDTSMIGSSVSKPTEEIVAQPSRVGVEQGTDAQVKATQRPRVQLKLSRHGIINLPPFYSLLILSVFVLH
uniref:Uncharacterized protein n=1 Tax=Solanum tuberosum TaxID=4113 RepID=M1DX64_SOLTU